MKHLYWIVVILFSFTFLTLISTSGKASADLAACDPNLTHTGYCSPNYKPPCYSPAGCVTRSSFSAWKLYLTNVSIEAAVAIIFVILLKKPKRLVLAVIAVNLVSWPVFYNLVSNVRTISPVVLGELAVWIFEATGIYLLCYGKISRRSAIVLSTLTNVATAAASFLLIAH
jgi:hypothetical protein